jgi:hypothetical protein
MHSLPLQGTLIALISLSILAFSFPSEDPQFKSDGVLSYPKVGEPIVEGSRCTPGITQCPAGTRCGGLYLMPDPVKRYCIHPDRPNLLEPFNCHKDSDCKTRQYCGQTPGEGGRYCKNVLCNCNPNDMFLGCIGNSPICEMFNWRDRKGGCLTGKGIHASCSYFG